MRWAIVAIVGLSSTGMLAVSVSMNFAFGSSFGRTAFEAYAYGAAFAFADILKVAAPIVVARSLANRNWAAAFVGLLVWGTFTVCSAVSAIGFASANRTFAMDTRTVQAALNQSRLKSLEADQSELRRLRDRLASPDLGRGERLQLLTAGQRLETAIGAMRGKLEDSAPVVSRSNPQAHTLAGLTGTDIDKVEIALILLVALLVEMGGLGPFVTMNLANLLRPAKVPADQQSTPLKGEQTLLTEPLGLEPPAELPRKLPLTPIVLATENLQDDLGSFLNLHVRRTEGFTLSSTELLVRYNGSRREGGRSQVSQRRFGDTMNALGYRKKSRLASGHVHYQGLAWMKPEAPQLKPALRHNGGYPSHASVPGAPLAPN
jgi:hypothetical protein